MMKALICITTSKRSLAVKTFVWDYIDFCQKNPEYDFVISLDGLDKKTIDFCTKHNIPLVYSEAQEGVGLSKNRILSSYPSYDHFFFIEDDVGLLDGKVFNLYIQTASELGLQHMSLFPEDRIGGKTKEITLKNGFSVICSLYGGAPFNYFSKMGINTVGGFHTNFAKYRRFGHTEHSYRFVNAGLAEYPFYIIKECIKGYLRWSDPVSVTKVKVDTINRLFVDEHKLIEQKLAYFPLTTLSGFKTPDTLDILSVKKPFISHIYPLIFEANMAALALYRFLKKLRFK